MIDLTRSLEDRQDSANLQIAILSFINVIINYKAGEVSCAGQLEPTQLELEECMQWNLTAHFVHFVALYT